MLTCDRGCWDCEEVTPEQLERISAELVLTASDVELMLESQERVLGELP